MVNNVFCISGNIRTVSYVNNIFVAVTEHSSTFNVLTSSNGISWTLLNAGNGVLYGITYGNNTFVIVGKANVYTSADGSSWTSRTPASGLTNMWGVAYGNSTFVLVGDDGGIQTSFDGISWTSRASNTSNLLYYITYGNSTSWQLSYQELS